MIYIHICHNENSQMHIYLYQDTFIRVHSTSVLSFYIDVVLTLSMGNTTVAIILLPDGRKFNTHFFLELDKFCLEV